MEITLYIRIKNIEEKKLGLRDNCVPKNLKYIDDVLKPIKF
jgi:hypothetical protein